MVDKKVSKELLLFLKLISFFKKIRHQETEEQAHFFLVNDLYNIIPYKQCIVWAYKNNKVVLKNASGQVDVSQRSPYAQFVIAHIENIITEEGLKSTDDIAAFFEKESFSAYKSYSLADYNKYEPNDVKEWVSPHSVCFFLRDKNNIILGGIWLERNEAFSKVELAMIADVGDAYADKLAMFKSSKRFFKKSGGVKGKYKKIVLAALVFLCFLPVRNSMVVDVEVVSEDVRAISVPYNGLIKEVLVSPNQLVKEGDVLFFLDRVQLENNYNIALQELETSRKKLEKTQLESFADPAKKSDFRILQEQIKLKEIDVRYAQERLNAASVRANRSGIILFSDKNDLLGQPIQAGQQVMTLANPESIELLIRIPSDGMIKIDRDVHIKFFLNISPLESHKAAIKTVSYKPQKGANGIFGYSARADIVDVQKIERIGLTGTGKVYGGRTILILNILRRPFIAMRNILRL